MLDTLTKENPNCVILDSGNITNSASTLDLITDVMARAKYDAVGLGSLDVTLGDVFYKKLAEKKITLINCLQPSVTSAVPYLIKNTNGVRVGIVSFGPPAAGADQNSFGLLRKLYGAYKAARQASDILVVLDQPGIVTKEWIDRNEARLGAPDIVIGGAARSGFEQDVVIGKTHFVPTSIQAKALGVVDIEFTSGQGASFTVKKMALGEEIKEDPAVVKMVRDLLHKNDGTTNNDQAGNATAQEQPKQDPYYSPQLCRACHEKQYDDWSKTKHATALRTLIKADRAVPECLPCHSTMYSRSRRYVMTKDNIAGVDCATCHSKSLPHGEERAAMSVNAPVDTRMCVSCHNKERSPKFDEKSYMPKVAHMGTTETKTASTPAESPKQN